MFFTKITPLQSVLKITVKTVKQYKEMKTDIQRKEANYHFSEDIIIT